LKRVWAGLAVVLCLLLILLIWSAWIEPRRLVVREATLALEKLESAHPGLRVAVLADLHIGSPHHGLAKLRAIVAAVNEREPDLVVILGDLVTQGVLGGSVVAPERIAPLLAELDAPLGTFAVLGNHDYWYGAALVAASLRSAGVTVLEDEGDYVTAGGQRIWLAGVTDYWEGRHDIAGALASVPENEPSILLTHNPDVFPEVPERVDLTLAGHTHGGQVNLPVLGRLIVPSRFGQRYAAGLVAEGGKQLFVSTGTGTSILPIRFRVPPEVVMLNLQPADRRN
jgi:hypothetical protein